MGIPPGVSTPGCRALSGVLCFIFEWRFDVELNEEKQLQWCSRFAKAFNATNKDGIERIELHDGGGITACLNQEQVCLLVACNDRGSDMREWREWFDSIEKAVKHDTAQYRKGSGGAIHAVRQIVRAALQRGNRNGANQIEHKIVLLIPAQKPSPSGGG